MVGINGSSVLHDMNMEVAYLYFDCCIKMSLHWMTPTGAIIGKAVIV